MKKLLRATTIALLTVIAGSQKIVIPFEQPNRSTLIIAIQNGDVATVNSIIAKSEGKYINICDSSGMTPLLHALLHSSLANKTPNADSAKSKENLQQIIKICIAAGAQVNQQDNYAITALMYAAKDNCPANLKTLIDAKANVNMQNNRGNTALMYASTAENIKVLIAAGANVHIQDNSGKTALMYASTAETIKVLIAAGANVHIQDNAGKTALMYAAIRNDSPAITTLLTAGANQTVKDETGNSAFDYAVPNSEAETFLCNPNDLKDAIQRKKDLRLISLATINNRYNTDLIKELIADGANPNAQNSSGGTALSYAVTNNCIEISLLLIEYTTNVKVLSSALLESVLDYKKEALIVPLLKAGANPNFQDIRGNTALHYAVFFNYGTICTLLVKAGADITLKNNDGSTALDFVAVAPEIISLLRNK